MKTLNSQQEGSPNRLTYKIKTYEEMDKKIIDIKDDFRRQVKRPCRVTVKVWKTMLLNNQDIITVDGNVRSLIAKNIGAGVYEISLKEI